MSFNEEHIKIYDSGNLSVVDAAMHASFPNEGIFPRRGPEINYTINGRKAMKRGSLGEPARISLNGEPADMHTPIRANDVIVVEESTTGEAAKLLISELPEYKSMIAIKANDSRILLPRIATVNGEPKTEYYEVQDGDEIVMRDYYTVREVREFMDVLLDKGSEVLVNNEVADDDTKVYENFTIKWGLLAEKALQEQRERKEAAESAETDEDAGEEAKSAGTAAGLEAVSFDELPEDDGSYVPSESAASSGPVKELQVSVNGSTVTLSGKPEYVFVDVFDFIDFDLTSVKGKQLITELNGHKAEYMETIRGGDEITIRWEG